ncbi:hypothetical protein COTS27_01465 [Spirochaetota bacterium]|nr:hypothetical protein COTS27_01465 [Spirochaetota bacterium]
MNQIPLRSEVSPKQKRNFYIFLIVYLLGYFLLLFIGDSINETGFTLLAFISPLAVLIGVIGITLSLCIKRD